MTEKEAKTKWCPQRPVLIDGLYNRNERCIASTCMMWQQDTSYWAKDGIKIRQGDMHKYRTPEEGGLDTITEGHCGLISD